MMQIDRAEPAGAVRRIGTRRAVGRHWRQRLVPVAQHTLLAAVAFVFVVPIYWMVISGLKDNAQIFARPLVWWPPTPRWHTVVDVLVNYPGFPFLRFLANSLFYAGAVTIGTVLSCAVVAYGFARLRFPGRDLLFALTVSTMMIPQIVTFIPTYVLFKYLHLLGSYAPLIIPTCLGNAFFIFMLRQFFMGLPWELSEAAKVDGAGELRIFWRIMLPLVRSALIVVAVFSFTWTWQDFFGPLVYLSDPNLYPLSLGLFAFQGQHTTDWAALMMASTLTSLPLIVLFFFTQRYFLQGITLTGLKG